ncbi:MAG: hypothetical protein H6868_01670 [Rhodospirillales bacterium]|nr:hypothetical protein [Rhodospirillales bacterium]
MAKQKKTSIVPGMIAGFVMLLIVGGAFLYLNFGNIAKVLTEKIGSETLGVRVSLTKMDIAPQEKRVDVSGLKIANPPGYKKPQVLTVDTIRVVGESFSKELLVFKEITVSGTNINMEVTENGTNLSDLKKNIKPKASADEKTASGEPIKVIIRKLTIDDATLSPAVMLIDRDMAPVTMPDLVMTGIGQKTNGVLVSEAVAQVLDRVTKEATRAASQQGMLQGMDEQALKELGAQMNIGQGLLDQTKEDVKGLTEGIKNLFGN